MIKTFEEYKEPIEGSYCIIKQVEDKIGLITNTTEHDFIKKTGLEKVMSYQVDFDSGENYLVARRDIIFYSKNKSEVEAYLTANKYNL